MKVLITGGTGFIGSRLGLRCLGRGDDVRVLGADRGGAEAENRKLLEEHGAEIVLGSVVDREAMFRLVEGADVVFHLAAAQHEANVPDQVFWDVNVTGTENLLDASVAAGVRRFVHGSTIGVYQADTGATVHPNSPLLPDNIYGTTKLKGEERVRAYRDKLPVTIARISETYGPGDRRLLKLFRGVERGVFFNIGPGQNLHHLVHIDDLVDGLLRAADSDRAVGETYVLAGPRPVSTDEMGRTVAEVLAVKPPRLRIPITPLLWVAAILETVLRPLGIQPPLHRRRMDFFRKSFSFDPGHAEELVGYRPKIEFAQGAEETADWYRARGELGAGGQGVSMHFEPPEIDTSQLPTLTAKMEPFDSFWEGPENIEKGYDSFQKFYDHNYLPHCPKDRGSRILVVSCGPGYFVHSLVEAGYTDVLGIDSDPEKVAHGVRRGLDCQAHAAFPYLQERPQAFDAIICEQELNHLTKDEMIFFLALCRKSLRPGGTLIVHGLNGANPLTGAESLAQNFDHYNTFTEYTLNQLLEYTGFQQIRILPLELYVFFKNPLNYVGMAIMAILSFAFRVGFILYGKNNKTFTKKIGAVASVAKE